MPEIGYELDKRIQITVEQLAAWTVTETRGVLQTSGPCPACQHEFPVEIVRDVIAATATEDQTMVPPEKRTTRRFACKCTTDHPGRPAAIMGGCGRWWLASVVSDEVDGRKLVPAPDQGLASAATALDAASRDEVTAVRAWAEKWLPAVAALYGLFGLASVVLGKDALEHIPLVGRLVVAGLIGVGLISTIRAIFFGYSAAFGWLTLRKVENDAELEDWYKQRRAALAAAPLLLKKALNRAVTALVFLMFAVGVIWFWPPTDPPSPLVQVSYNQDGDTTKPMSACGKLVDSKDKQLTVQSAVGATKQAIPINVAWVQSVTAKDAC